MTHDEEFATLVLSAVKDELALARERAKPDEPVAVWQRARSSSGLHAVLILGNQQSIDQLIEERLS